MRLVLLVAAGGALGSVLRYLVGLALAGVVGAGFPWAVLLVNVVGSFAIGFVTALGLELSRIPDEARVFWTTGVMGGLTTYSAFSMDLVRYLEAEAFVRAALYFGATSVLALLACAGGLFTARLLGP
ncbi:CrcB family protein [Myxococcota bacterium]|jgi:CrcB protein|nr:CrcB family protein [Myxococcota bacterium]